MLRSLLRRNHRFAAAPALTAATLTFATAVCEADQHVKADLQSTASNQEEEDEPTSCTICMINRQGPCRDQWRGFERCMKQHAKDSKAEAASETAKKEVDAPEKGDAVEATEGTARDAAAAAGEGSSENTTSEKKQVSVGEKCEADMMPWLECIQSKPNIYSQLADKVYQDVFIDSYENELERFADMRKWDHVDLDLTDYWDYVKMNKLSLQDIGGHQTDWNDWFALYGHQHMDVYIAGRDNRVWTHMLNGPPPKPIYDAATFKEDPILIEVRVAVNLKDEHDGLPLDLVYARDENGRILGTDRFEDFTGDVGILEMRIQPGETKSVKLFKVYKDEELLRCYTTRAMYFVEEAHAAGVCNHEDDEEEVS